MVSGDVLSVVLIALVIKRLTQNSSPFETLNGFLVFDVVGAIIGPFISALFGFIEQVQYATALSTWWVGDGVGVLLFTPLLLSVIGRERALSPHFFPVLLFCVVVFAAATATLFSLIPPFVWLIALWVLLVPVAFVAMLYAGQRLVFIVQVVISSIAIMSTYLGKGPFVAFELLTPLMSLQLFVGMFSCVLFALAVVVNQKQ
jgi:integral membrane sensor domain MASE1